MSVEILDCSQKTATALEGADADQCPLTQAEVLGESDLPAWDHFVSSHPQASVYHLSVWRHIVARACGKPWYVVGVIEDGRVRGGIPFVHMKSALFGNFLVSMPYVNYGGLLVEHESLVQPILDESVRLAQRVAARHIELRHLQDYCPTWPSRTEKVSMWLDLPPTSEALFQRFKPKLRSQIRKGEKNGLHVREGGIELLDDFYAVFAQNMRDLGTPVYNKLFFQLILEAFPKSARLMVVTDAHSLPIAGGFLLGFRNRLEIPWASSLRQYNRLQSNMWLYWHCLRYGCEQGYEIFDFGRSTVGSSTFKFKKQWGAVPVKHYWHYWLEGSHKLPRLNPDNPKFRLAITLWRHLPVSVTRLVGPAIARHLP
ncbi:MAG: FemAB family PEP-CTERM system-associated protein [Nitrospirae bacterium]|nr:MAG: FemAB family PEP-CTERM system-associated protein [Nitrospirota bacterium]